MKTRYTLLDRQHGMSLVSAIFLLVVLAGLGVFAVRINVLQQLTVTSGLRAAQAFRAYKGPCESEHDT